jgi:predicted DNA-binding transcriptional regulator AlpA
MTDPAEDLVTITVACQIIGGRETPITASTLYKGIKTGRFPAPLKLGPGTARWRRSEIIDMLEKAAAERGQVAA